MSHTIFKALFRIQIFSQTAINVDVLPFKSVTLFQFNLFAFITHSLIILPPLKLRLRHIIAPACEHILLEPWR